MDRYVSCIEKIIDNRYFGEHTYRSITHPDNAGFDKKLIAMFAVEHYAREHVVMRKFLEEQGERYENAVYECMRDIHK